MIRHTYKMIYPPTTMKLVSAPAQAGRTEEQKLTPHPLFPPILHRPRPAQHNARQQTLPRSQPTRV